MNDNGDPHPLRWAKVARGTTRGANHSPAHAIQVHDATRRYRRVNRVDLLNRLQGNDWRYGEIVAAICEWYGCAESTARRNLKLGLEYGYIQRGLSGYRVTPLGESQLRMYGQLTGIEGVRFARYCSGRPALRLRTATAASPPPASLARGQ
jgi:hypothetical protein